MPRLFAPAAVGGAEAPFPEMLDLVFDGGRAGFFEKSCLLPKFWDSLLVLWMMVDVCKSCFSLQGQSLKSIFFFEKWEYLPSQFCTIFVLELQDSNLCLVDV